MLCLYIELTRDVAILADFRDSKKRAVRAVGLFETQLVELKINYKTILEIDDLLYNAVIDARYSATRDGIGLDYDGLTTICSTPNALRSFSST